jgi:hypothetical protein
MELAGTKTAKSCSAGLADVGGNTVWTQRELDLAIGGIDPIASQSAQHILSTMPLGFA